MPHECGKNKEQQDENKNENVKTRFKKSTTPFWVAVPQSGCEVHAAAVVG